MENDLKSQIASLLDKLCAERHVTDGGRHLLQRWFVETLEGERRGWKGRLKDAARAADVEHRQTLTAHAAIQQVIGYIYNRIPPSSLNDPLSPPGSPSSVIAGACDFNGGDSTDRKASRIVQLNKYWESVDRYIGQLESERTACLRILGVTDDDNDNERDTLVDLKAELQSRIGDIEKETTRKAVVASLSAENGELRDRLRSIVRSERISKERHEREMCDLKKTTKTLEQHLVKKTELIERLSTTSTICISHRDEAVQTDSINRRRTTIRNSPSATVFSIGAMSTGVGTEETSANSRASTPHSNTKIFVGAIPHLEQRSTTPMSNDMQPQVVAAEIPNHDFSVAKTITPTSLVSNSEQIYRKYAAGVQHQQNIGMATCTSSSSSTFPLLSATKKLNTYDATFKSINSENVQGVKTAVHWQTTAVVLPNIVSPMTSTVMGVDSMPTGVSARDRVEWKPYSPSYLRGQVLSFANKLEETKRDMDACQRELVRLKATAFATSQSDINRTTKHMTNDVTRRQRHQRQVLAAKSVTTLHLPPVDQLLATPRSLRENESRVTESIYRVTEIDNDVHYTTYARRHRNGNKQWRM